MNRISPWFGALVGGIAIVPAIALMYLGQGLARLPFVPFDLFDWLARVLPGNLITLGIDIIVAVIGALNLGPTGTTAKLLEQLMALMMVVAAGAVVGALIALALRRTGGNGRRLGAIGGGLLFLVVAAIELSFGLAANVVASLLWLAALLVSWGALVGGWLGRLGTAVPDTTASTVNQGRRDFIFRLAGGSAGVALGAWGLGALARGGQVESTAQGAATPLESVAGDIAVDPQATATALATSRDRIMPAPGTRQEVSPDGQFYRIDINTRPVVIDGDSWQLQVDGLFDSPRPLTLSDLMQYPAVTQAVTMSCISNSIGGDLIGTAFWTGARLRDVLTELGLQRQAVELFVESADGFYESVAMMDMMDPRTLLVYGMNGETLPVKHGFPLRIYIPNRYGMKQPKWITRIEAIPEEGPGYWVERGWSAEAHPRVVSVIDAVATEAEENGRIPIGGIAWAGDRGISKVELQVDGGEWVEAALRNPPLSQLTWVQWRYDWPSQPGRHRFRVRATDGAGALQIEEEMPKRPDGATGYHERTVRI